MLLHGINDNILIPNLSYLGVYQDEEKRAIQRDKYCFWVGIKPQKMTILGIKIYIYIPL